MRGVFFIIASISLARAESDLREPVKAGHTKVTTKLGSEDTDKDVDTKVIAVKAKPIKAQTTTKKITAVVEDDSPDTPEKQHLRSFTDVKSVGHKNGKLSKSKETKAAPIKEHKSDDSASSSAPKKGLGAKSPSKHFVEESDEAQTPANQVALVNQANELANLEEELAGRALAISETALADGGITADENLSNQNYLRNVAEHSAKNLEGEADDAYNQSEGDLTQSQFADAQADGNWIVDPTAGTDFVGVGSAWQKMKKLFGADKSSSKSSTSTAVVKTVTEVQKSPATAFKIPSQTVSRSDSEGTVDHVSNLLEEDAGDADDEDENGSATIVVPESSEDDD